MRTWYLPLVLPLLFGLATRPIAAQPSNAGHTEQSSSDLFAASAATQSRFIENRGQWHPDVRFAAQCGNTSVWITTTGIVFDHYTLSSQPEQRTQSYLPPDRAQRRGHVVRMEFQGAAATAGVRGLEPLPGRFNFLLGNDRSRWATNITAYRNARISNLYPGVDAVAYFDHGQPRYDMVLAPGATPGAIRLRFAGADAVVVDQSGNLVIQTSMGPIIQRDLFAYQTVQGARRQVQCRFALHADGTVGFVPGAYDASKPLVIDPIVYSTFAGGSGSDAALTMAVDNAGNAYAAGYASRWESAPSDAFPTTVGAYNRVYGGGGTDAFVAKFDPTSDTLVYATLLGGDSFDEIRGIVLDGSNNAYVCGFTSSGNFPSTQNSFAPNYVGGQSDGFVAKLNPAGNVLVFSTFLGGHVADGAYGLALASDGSIRVAGYTASADFPATPNCYDPSFNGGTGDIFIATLSASGTSLPSATFVGGNGNDAGLAVSLDGAGNAYVTGVTASSDFPVTGTAYDRSYNGGAADMFVVKMNPVNNALLYCSYLGGANEDHASDIEVSGANSVTLCGYTASPDYPTTPGTHRSTYGGGAYDGAVTKLNLATNTLDYSTFLGRASDDYAFALEVQPDGSLYVCGSTISDSFPTTIDAYDRVHKANSFDAFVVLLNPTASQITYGTFIGGGDREEAYDIKARGQNEVYLCGTTRSPNFPIGPHRAYDSLGRVRNGNEITLSYDAFVTKLDIRNVTILYPTTQRLLCLSDTTRVEWASPRVGSVNVVLEDVSTGARIPLASGIAASGGFWPMGIGNYPAGSYRFRVSDASDTSVFGLSAVVSVPPKPAFTAMPQGNTICFGTPIELRAQAKGLGIRYVWRHDGEQLGAASTNGTLTIPSATWADSGTYEVTAYDTCHTEIRASARIALHVAPIVRKAPEDKVVCEDEPLLLEVITSGGTPAYQWNFEGQPIPGATTPQYSVPKAKQSNGGEYTVSITYPPCSAQPMVVGPVHVWIGSVRITTQPVDQRTSLGGIVRFEVVATGIGNTYQWRHNGVPIPGATSASLEIRSATAADTGSYDVVVTGSCTRTSNTARLSIDGVGGVARDAAAPDAFTMAATPNPASNMVTVTVASRRSPRTIAGLQLGLYDTGGRLIMDLTGALARGDYHTATFAVGTLASGTYYCRLSGAGLSNVAARIVVDH